MRITLTLPPDDHSRGCRLRVVPNSFVKIAKLELVVASLGHLADDTSRLACDNAEARNDHVCGDDRAVKDADVVLDDGKLANHHLRADVNVAPDGGRLDNGTGADVHVVAHSKWHICKRPTTCQREKSGIGCKRLPLVEPAWGSETASSAEEAVATNGDSGVIWRGAARRRG